MTLLSWGLVCLNEIPLPHTHAHHGLSLLKGNSSSSLWAVIQNEVKREAERRRQGKEMLDYKKKLEDDKTKRILEERNREKAEEKAARDRVKQQIALVSRESFSLLFIGGFNNNQHKPASKNHRL